MQDRGRTAITMICLLACRPDCDPTKASCVHVHGGSATPDRAGAEVHWRQRLNPLDGASIADEDSFTLMDGDEGGGSENAWVPVLRQQAGRLVFDRGERAIEALFRAQKGAPMFRLDMADVSARHVLARGQAQCRSGNVQLARSSATTQDCANRCRSDRSDGGCAAFLFGRKSGPSSPLYTPLWTQYRSFPDPPSANAPVRYR